MSFDPLRVQAEISLGKIPPESFPTLAQDALEAGYDGRAIVRIAILEHPSGWEIDRILPTFMHELGLGLLSKSVASILLARYLARDVLELKAGSPHLRQSVRAALDRC